MHDDTNGNSKNMEDDVDIGDAIEVIRWYQFFAAAKVYRALMGLEDKIIEGASAVDDAIKDNELDEDELQFGGGGNDSDGSAKIALIAVDRLRRTTEQVFPRARDFIRPGFDEVISDFVS